MAPAAFSWSATAMDAQAVEEGLAQLLRAAVGDSVEEEGSGGIRTSVLNLVSCATDGKEARQVAETIASLSNQHPSRSVIVTLQPGDDVDRVDVDLSAHCYLTGPERDQVCCEEVRLTVHGTPADHLQSLVTPLLVPDLPTFFWWAGDLPDRSPAIDRFIGTADRFLVDSSCFRTPMDDLPRLSRLCLTQKDCSIGDFSWTRIGPWLNSVAELFDPAPFTPDLKKISRLEVDYGAGGNWSQPLLLVGWLTVALGWTGVSQWPEDQAWMLEGEGGVLTVRLAERDVPGAEPGSLVAVRLTAGEAEFSLHRGDHAQSVTAVARRPGNVMEWRSHLKSHLRPDLLSEELGRPGRDELFERALHAASTLLSVPEG